MYLTACRWLCYSWASICSLMYFNWIHKRRLLSLPLCIYSTSGFHTIMKQRNRHKIWNSCTEITLQILARLLQIRNKSQNMTTKKNTTAHHGTKRVSEGVIAMSAHTDKCFNVYRPYNNTRIKWRTQTDENFQFNLIE